MMEAVLIQAVQYQSAKTIIKHARERVAKTEQLWLKQLQLLFDSKLFLEFTGIDGAIPLIHLGRINNVVAFGGFEPEEF
ncbi:hypothetical protein LSTR_LSTR001816 [Laodelphax striatellus]|uniref:Uncharacterized protein n=1 Tax=Laodelphax striatellus TaxID=195883 RepID=A0A482WGD5_LAOST|nr:hypothetical protein LSTR_LSTR001816 [Laodelphax striatellus]